MNQFDTVIFILLTLFAIRGIFRGLVTELIVLISLVLGFLIAFTYFPQLQTVLLKLFPLLPPFAARIIAFVILFLVVNIALRLIGKALNKLVHFTFLNSINRLAGGLFGFFKAALMVSLFIMIVEQTPFTLQIKRMIGAENSVSYDALKNIAPGVYDVLLSVIPGENQLQQDIINSIQKMDSTTQKMVNPFGNE